MDVSALWNVAEGRADWALVGPDLQQDPGLVTAVILSLFTDARADSDDVIPDGSGDRRGWWGDTGKDRPIGSKLWLLERRKATPQTLLDAKSYAAEALAWLITDGVAVAVDVAAAWVRANVLGLVVTVSEPDGRKSVFNFESAWAGLS
jgi:phage gp46-like protein